MPLLLGLLLVLAPVDSYDELDDCLAQAPIEDDPPLTWSADIEAMWSSSPPVSPDTLRTYLPQIRRARTCLLSLDPSEVERPYLGNVMRTFYVETALLAGLRRFSEAFGTFESARSYLSQDHSIPSSEGERAYWAPVLHQNQGFLHYLLGDLPASIEHYLKAHETTPDTKPGRQIQFLVDLGTLHQRMQDFRSARHFFNRAENKSQAQESALSGRPRLRARVYHVQADLLLEKTLSTEYNRDSLKRVTELAQRSHTLAPSGSERHARASMLLSESLGSLGATERAYRLNETAQQYARMHDDVRLQTFALSKLGVLHMQTQRWTQADSTLHEALRLAESIDGLDYQRRILRDLGRLYELQGRWAEAESVYRKGVGVVEEYRQSLTASQWSLTAFAQWREMHRGLVRVLLARDRPRQALATLGRSRARHLQDLRTQARISKQLPLEQRTRLDSLSSRLTDVRTRLGESSLSNSSEAHLRNREAALMAARQQLLQIDSASSRPSLNAISETLTRQDRVLVSYFLDDPSPAHNRSPRSVAFVLTGDSLRTVPLPGLTQDSVQAHLKSTSPLFTSRGKPDRANAMHFNLRPLHALHDAVYAPVADHLPSDRPLTVIPDGPLFYTPFSMLVHSMPGGRFAPSEARYVLHDRPTSMELVSSLVADTSRRTFDWSQFSPQMAAYGVSDFDTLRTVPSTLRSAIPEAIDDSSLVLPSLPGVRDELQALESTVPDAQVSLNEKATESDFCRSVRKAGVLHVASHAFVNSSSPLQNAILLRPDSAGQSASDGILFLHELQEQRARIPLVVLSGCSTAAGTLRGGEGMEGLQYAFRAMGAQSTVSTLWPVADQASRKLMDAFYQYVQNGDPKDVALRQARLDFLEAHPQRASPFFWAPPVLYGSPVALPLDDSFLPSWAWWSFAFGGLALALLLGWWLWTRKMRSARTFSSS